MSFRRRRAITAALTANAIRPVPGFGIGVPAFFAGWLTGELAPHVLALTAADAAVHSVAPGRRRDPVGLALAGASAAGLGYLIWQSRSVREHVEAALVEGLGLDYVEQLDDAPTPADLATPWRSLVNPFRTLRVHDPAVHVERDIAFGEAGSRHHLDIYAPAGRQLEGAPVLLQVHGGAWTIGKKDQQGIPLMRHLAAKGWVCVAINYRLAPRDPFPAQIIDVKQGIAWIRDNIAAYGGDPGYIAITGGSAGGHLTALAALTANDPAWQPGFEDVDTSVQVAVPHYGVYDVAGATGLRSVALTRDRFMGPKVFKKRYATEPEAFEAASPILRVSPDAPDFLVLHGTHDSLVGVQQARMFVAKLREVSKRTVVYAELPGAQHAFDVFPSIRSAHIVRAIDRYLHWHWNQYRRERSEVAAATQE
jgi:acetyl esterase/lipase